MFDAEARARCWAEIDLDALIGNYRRALDKLAPGATLIPVVKGDGYGCGAAAVAAALYGAGARLFAVATVSEGLLVRRAVDADVLVMGPAGDALFGRAIASGLILTVYSTEQARRLSAAAEAMGARCRVHLKLDSGMHRLGFDPETAAQQMADAASLPGLRAEGFFSHLALHSPELDARQFERFDAVLAALAARDLALMPHLLDSIGFLRYPDRQYAGVRIGAWLYGVCPYGYSAPESCQRVVTLRARATQVRRVAAGELIGYEDHRTLDRDSVIATLACGFADGVPRHNWAGAVEIRGRRAPVVGLVCMDQMMVDVTDIDGVRENDVATLLGGSITLDEYAAFTPVNRNDALTRLSRRVPRIYQQQGQTVGIRDDMA